MLEEPEGKGGEQESSFEELDEEGQVFFIFGSDYNGEKEEKAYVI